MREIKFRGWNKEEKKMYPDVQDAYDFLGDVPATTFGMILELPEQWDVMQFTGLKDKNGREIYEGDVVRGIVKFPQLLTGDTDENSNFAMVGEVFYDLSGFELKAVQHLCDEKREGMFNYFSFIGSDGEVFSEMEVIGNVWQNPDLLKV